MDKRMLKNVGTKVANKIMKTKMEER